ncbi:hypothetical protein [Geomonas azotofigens]|uniref:hypothetical protein n=1 Tax=Geomonas azotofigens TaxID=2843196 RepID=UPI001C118C94|nr:hypothetical protein [Geomonas azotofigens]MBU5612171.1 hypothetical protein [Geomonas azotofigens]
MSNDPKSPKDKLLQASGLKKPANEREELLRLRNEMVGRIDALVQRGEAADKGAQEAKRLMEQMLQRLEVFCDEQLPTQVTHAIEMMAQQKLDSALRPLELGVQAAEQRINQCDRELTSISWNWRILAGPLIIGLFTALIGAGMVRCTHIQAMDDAREYELFGRKVKKVIAGYGAEEQRKIYDWIDGVPQPPPRKEAKKRR